MASGSRSASPAGRILSPNRCRTRIVGWFWRLASGAWREFDVTREDPYRAVVGERLLGYRTTRTSLDALDGVILEFEELSIILETHGADELFVTWADPPLRVRPLS